MKLQYSINFVDPTTGAHTQTIEGTWSQVKFMMRKRGVMNTSDDLFDTYLPEYLWRRKLKNDYPSLKMYEHVKELNTHFNQPILVLYNPPYILLNIIEIPLITL